MFEVSRADREQLFALYEEAFGDGRAYYDRYFDAFAADGEIVAVREAGEIVSALYLLPQTLLVDQKDYPCAYLYAAATRSTARGRGLMSGLICKAKELATRRGCAALVTLPASDSLYGYYARFGLEASFSLRSFCADAAMLPAVRCAAVGGPLTYADYVAAMRALGSGVVRGEATFALALANSCAAGFSGTLLTGATPGYAVWRCKEGRLEIMDGILSADQLSALCAAAGEDVKKICFTGKILGADPFPAGSRRYGSAVLLDAVLSRGQIADLYMNMMME